LYAVLKLVAYGDRKADKDLASLDHLFRNYAESDSRRWGLEFAGDLVSDDFASAHLLGLDGSDYLGDSVTATLSPLLDRLSAQEDEGPADDGRPRRSTLFLWFRRGLGI
jgi:predicted nucleotidyltransferase